MTSNNVYAQPYLHCHVKNARNQEAAVFIAQETIHPSKWHYNGKGGEEELFTLRAYRNRNGTFGAQQRRGYYLVKFTPLSAKGGE